MIRKIDLNEWTLFSERRNSKNYYSNDKKYMVKFGTEFTKRSEQELKDEQELTKRIVEIGVKTPNVYDIVDDGNGNLGLVYEYIGEKKSIARAMSEDIENYDKYMKIFSEMAKEFHKKECDKNKFDSYEERVVTQIKRRDMLTLEQKEKALNIVSTIEKKNTIIHSDFQPGNFIIANDKKYIIDLGGVAYGNSIFDVSVLYAFTNFMPYPIADGIFHCDIKYLKPIWESFVKYYFGKETKEEIDKITSAMRKYSVVGFMGMFSMVEPPNNDELKEIFIKQFDEGLKDDTKINL